MVFGLTRPRIDTEATVSVAYTLSTWPLLVFLLMHSLCDRLEIMFVVLLQKENQKQRADICITLPNLLDQLVVALLSTLT